MYTAWQTAVRQATDLLTSAERARFGTSRPEDIVSDFATAWGVDVTACGGASDWYDLSDGDGRGGEKDHAEDEAASASVKQLRATSTATTSGPAARASTKESVRRVVGKMRPLVTAIEGFGGVGGAGSGTSGGSGRALIGTLLDGAGGHGSDMVLSPIYGTLRAVLMAARNHRSYFTGLVDMLVRISDVLPRLQDYEMALRDHDGLRNAMAALYLAIIGFLVQARKVFPVSDGDLGDNGDGTCSVALADSTTAASARRNRLRKAWRPFAEEFERSLTDFRDKSDLVDRTAAAAHMLAQTRRSQDMLDLIAQQSRELTLQRLELAYVKSALENQRPGHGMSSPTPAAHDDQSENMVRGPGPAPRPLLTVRADD